MKKLLKVLFVFIVYVGGWFVGSRAKEEVIVRELAITEVVVERTVIVVATLEPTSTPTLFPSLTEIPTLAPTLVPTLTSTFTPIPLPTATKVPPPSPTPVPVVVIKPTAKVESECDPSYPDVCIPNKSKVGDLDCGDIPYRRFRVLPPDLHGFDGDGDGIGCES